MPQQNKVKKVEDLRAQGYNPYPGRFDKEIKINEILDLELGTQGIKTAGRIITIRRMGRLTFAHLVDFSDQIQISFSESTLLKKKYKEFSKFIDNGDYIGICGELYKTRKGEITINVQEYFLLSKCLRELPEKWHGLQDTETKWRQRYLDILINDDTRQRFKQRTLIIRFLRNYLENKNFWEVETPVLQHQISGGNAKPFITYHNGLAANVVLRIAPETFLKRLLVGGYERVFEFARTFRNEDMDASHLQDFSMLEYYVAYWDYKDNMKFLQEMIKSLLQEVFGTLKIVYDETELDFSGEWPIITFRDTILQNSGIDIEKFSTIESLQIEIKEKGIDLDFEPGMGMGKLLDKLYKKVSRPNLIQPTFLVNHPVELVPLARKNDENPNILDMVQLLVNGWEIVKAYSELVDPIEQRKRFEEQARLKEMGDEEALDIDEDYLKAMEYGMPPVSGVGIGLDRLVALLTNAPNVRDAVLFPLLKQLE